MGISGLYDFISECVTHRSTLTRIAGSVVAVDMPCWVHRGAITDAQNVVMFPNRPSEKINNFVEKRLNLLKKYNITPICVFDGNKLPSKKDTNDKRRERRNEAKGKAVGLLKAGQDAYKMFIQAVRISDEINQGVKDVCSKAGHVVITAPYEADAQLAWLSMENRVDAVVTEDSDLFIFGTKQLVTKLDDSGKCDIVELARIDRVKELAKFDDQLKWLRYACIIQGCDYLPKGIPGFGLKTAIKLLVKAYETGDLSLKAILDKKSSYFKQKQLDKWDPDTAERLLQAENTFTHQIVIDSKTKSVKPFLPYPEGKSDIDFPQCGSLEEAEEIRKRHTNIELDIHVAKVKIAKDENIDQIMIAKPLTKPLKNNLKRKSVDDGQTRKKEFRVDKSWRVDAMKANLDIPVHSGCNKPMKSVIPRKTPVIADKVIMKSKYFRNISKNETSIDSLLNSQSKIESTTSAIKPEPSMPEDLLGLLSEESEEDEDEGKEVKNIPNTPIPKVSEFDKLFLKKIPAKLIASPLRCSESINKKSPQKTNSQLKAASGQSKISSFFRAKKV